MYIFFSRFEQILSVVFHDVPEEQTPADPLVSALRNSFKHLNLVQNELQVYLCICIYL